jgi:hypothetical protein
VSADLRSWTFLTNLTGAGPVVLWVDPNPATLATRFYRAIQR